MSFIKLNIVEKKDIQLFSALDERINLFLLFLFLFTLPLIIPNYSLYLVNMICVNVIVVTGLNILLGNTGQFSLGQSGFLAIGAYATILLMSFFHLPFLAALLIAGFIASGFGFFLGLPALRLEGPYLGITTLGFSLAVPLILNSMSIFGGFSGLKIPPIKIGFWILKSNGQLYYLIIIITIVMLLMAKSLLSSRIGRVFNAIRDSDIAAASLGVNVPYYKTLSFSISGFYAGIAGGLMAGILGVISPVIFDMHLSIYFLAMVVVGGLGSISGSIMGAILFTYLDMRSQVIFNLPGIAHLLRWFSDHFMDVGGMPFITTCIIGLFLVLVIVFDPYGLYGLWLRLKDEYLLKWYEDLIIFLMKKHKI